jgi:hypothetical protein
MRYRSAVDDFILKIKVKRDLLIILCRGRKERQEIYYVA